ncbi:DUF2512 family protein [Aneurinibacillus terranovensis]|uniref:DUF2512 family protein n=1 Tax=Aneurinibacillus terranovensis TaxID=278991 RepID=UPI00040972D6|nr:DUF2512 family protein [Aneurinibacillus terranovensis]
MKHGTPLLIKFVMTMAILYIILGLFYTVTFGTVFTMSVAVTVLAYLLGDLFILPTTGNPIASAADMGLTFLIIWFLSYLLAVFIPMTAILISTIVIGIGEWFFHVYLQNRGTRAKTTA